MKYSLLTHICKSFWLKEALLSAGLTLLFQIINPMCLWALTGEPSQPEVTGFTPAGLTEPVTPYTGDFSYNIPLISVGGCPLSLACSSGITMDQEASMVGLGWNLKSDVGLNDSEQKIAFRSGVLPADGYYI